MPTNHQRSIANHTVIRSAGDTAMIAFESGPSPDPRMVPRIHRYYRSSFHQSDLDNGRVFGHGLGPHCALLVKVTPGSLIQIVEWRPDKSHMAGRFYRIGADYEVIPLESGKREFSRAEIYTNLLASPVDELAPLVLTDSDLLSVFAASQPPWLQGITDAQLRHDQVHHVWRFYQFTPWRLDSGDIWRCVKAAPYLALARWKDRLTPWQLAHCIRKSPLGAVCFATERLPVGVRKSHLEKYAADALLHAADMLTIDELLRCASREPLAALTPKCRRILPPMSRAMLLARHYPQIRRGEMDEPLQDLQRDILDSVVGFPEEWLAAHHGGFDRVMGGLASSLSIRPDGAGLIEMLGRMGPIYQQQFAEYIASTI